MPDNFDEFLAYITHMRAEHKRLRECLRRLEDQWQLRYQRLQPGEAHVQIVENLEALRSELAHHFEEEELGGCLEEAVSHQPNLSGEFTRLEREHPELLAQMDRIIEGLRAASPPAASSVQIQEDFRALVQKLHAHEAAENHVLQESFGIEVE